jgi:hypothetical protein
VTFTLEPEHVELQCAGGHAHQPLLRTLVARMAALGALILAEMQQRLLTSGLDALGIAARCQLELPLDETHFPGPVPPVPTPLDELRRQAAEAPVTSMVRSPRSCIRLEHELTVIGECVCSPFPGHAGGDRLRPPGRHPHCLARLGGLLAGRAPPGHH